MSQHVHTMYRPPTERQNVLLRVADGCPHNACAFCAMYQGVTYRAHGLDKITRAVTRLAATNPTARRVFLADGDALALPTADLLDILYLLHQAWPALTRVTCYASGQTLEAKTDQELRLLQQAKLHTVYLGLESGSEKILMRMHKGASATAMVRGVQRVQQAGIAASVIVMTGLGGQEDSDLHVRETITALNAMQPRHLSCLRLIPVPGTAVARWIAVGRFTLLSETQAVRELRSLIAGLCLKRTVFRADHSSNILPLTGRLPADQGLLLHDLDELLAAGVLDHTGPGPMPSQL